MDNNKMGCEVSQAAQIYCGTGPRHIRELMADALQHLLDPVQELDEPLVKPLQALTLPWFHVHQIVGTF